MGIADLTAPSEDIAEAKPEPIALPDMKNVVGAGAVVAPIAPIEADDPPKSEVKPQVVGGSTNGNGDLLACVSAGAAPSKPKPVKDFHLEMANAVKQCLFKYYDPKTDGFVKKIATAPDFGKLAKSLSHRYRNEEKESFVAHGNNVVDIKMNPDMKERIRCRIEKLMEAHPVLP